MKLILAAVLLMIMCWLGMWVLTIAVFVILLLMAVFSSALIG